MRHLTVTDLMIDICLNTEYIYKYENIKDYFNRYSEDDRKIGRITEFVENSQKNFFKRFDVSPKFIKNVIFNLVSEFLPCEIEALVVNGNFEQELKIVFEFYLNYPRENRNFIVIYNYNETFPIKYNPSIILLFLNIINERNLDGTERKILIDRLSLYSNLYNIYK